MSRRTLLVLAIFFCLLTAFSGLALGQDVTASIVGTVTDPSGAPIKGADIAATDRDRGAVWTAKTDDTGAYSLLRLPTEIQGKVEAGELSFGHARTLLALESPESILKAAQKVLALSMSVRQTESFVQNMHNPEKAEKKEKSKEPIDPNVREARDQMQRALGLKVAIEDKGGKGKVIIEYTNLEAFDSLMERITGAMSA